MCLFIIFITADNNKNNIQVTVAGGYQTWLLILRHSMSLSTY